MIKLYLYVAHPLDLLIFYVENIPGILLEFLSQLTPKNLAFLVQGGFEEGCQLRCCEQYLNTHPKQLGCEPVGVLLKGRNSFIRYSKGKIRDRMLRPWKQMGREFANTYSFDTASAKKFTGKEHLSKFDIFLFNHFIDNYLRSYMKKTWKREMGCDADLLARPYDYK